MATYIYLPTFLTQVDVNWRPDLPSLVLGIVLGILIMVGVLRLRPFFRRHWQRASGWIHGRISWMRSGVEVRFQAETVEYVEKQHLGSEWAALSAVFVAPRFMMPITREYLKVEDRGATQMALLWPDLAAEIGVSVLPSSSLDQLLRNGRRVVIRGAAGAGKTTVLSYITYRLAAAEANSDDRALAEIVPIFFHLAELELTAAEGEAETELNPLDTLAAALQKRSSPLTAPGIRDMLQRKIESNQIVLLIDGWDEIALAQQPLVTTWLRALITAHKKTRIFMSAGLTGYGDLLSFGFVQTQIMPWRIGDVEQFLAQWVDALGLLEAPDIDSLWRPGQTPLETSLRFWLTAMAPDEPRPSTLTELLTAVTPLFQKRKKGDPIAPIDADILAFWQLVAARIKQKDGVPLPGEVVAECAAALSPAEEGEVDKSQAVRLRKSIGSSRLFVRWGSGGIGFVSSLWLDYFTAAFLQSGQGANAEGQVDNPRWRQVWRFYAGLTDSSPLAQKVLAADGNGRDRENLFQIAAWLGETKSPAPWVRQTMIDLGHMARDPSLPPSLRLRALAAMVRTQEAGLLKFLGQLLDRPDPVMRQLATAVLPLINDEKIISMLADRLVDEDQGVRLTAINSLALLQHKPLTERPLITALIGEDEEVELVAAELLALNRGPGIGILKEAAKDEDVHVRRAAILGLSNVDEDWVESLLVDIERHDDEWFVRSAANGALQAIRDGRQPKPWLPVRAADQPWLADIALHAGQPVPGGQAAIPFILNVLEEADDAFSKLDAIHLLALMPSRKSLSPLQELLENEEEETGVRRAANFTYALLRQAFES